MFRDPPTLLHRLWLAADAWFRPGGAELVKLTQAMLGPQGKLLSLVAFVADNLAVRGKLTG
ncbi:MAG: hypothetical protein HYX69_05040 [Planctomycetia bacterium]|nr:hypothetical protein [Planctomycetia bacterium]